MKARGERREARGERREARDFAGDGIVARDISPKLKTISPPDLGGDRLRWYEIELLVAAVALQEFDFVAVRILDKEEFRQ